MSIETFIEHFICAGHGSKHFKGIDTALTTSCKAGTVIAMVLQMQKLRQERVTDLSSKSPVAQLIRWGLESRHSGSGILFIIRTSAIFFMVYGEN